MRPKNRVFCAYAGRAKLLFETKNKAENFIRRNADEIGAESKTGKKPVRAYYCAACGGWHVTSREKLAKSEAYTKHDATECDLKQSGDESLMKMCIDELNQNVWMLDMEFKRIETAKEKASNLLDMEKMLSYYERAARKIEDDVHESKALSYKEILIERTYDFLKEVLKDRFLYTEIGASMAHALIRILGRLNQEEKKSEMIRKCKLMQRTLKDKRHEMQCEIGEIKRRLLTATELASHGLMVKANEIVEPCRKKVSAIREWGTLPRKIRDGLDYVERIMDDIRMMSNSVTVERSFSCEISENHNINKETVAYEVKRETGDSPAG